MLRGTATFAVRLLSRYLTAEIALPLAAWAVFLFLLLLAMQFLRGTEVVLGSAVRLVDVAQLASMLAPHFVVAALPIAFLLGLLLGLGRLGDDRELVALAAVGASPLRLLGVALRVGAFLSVLTLLLSCTLEPWGLSAVKGVVNEIIKRNVVGDVKSGVFYEDLTNLTVYAEQVDRQAGRWRRVLIHDDREPSAPLLALAAEAGMVPSAEGQALRLSLRDGTVHRKSGTEDYTLLSFERGEVVVGLAEAYSKVNRFRAPKQELTPWELIAAAREARQRGQSDRPFHLALHWRLAHALTPLAFAILGTGLALTRRREGRARGFLLTLLGYVGYYLLSRMFENWASQGVVPVALAAQMANVAFAALGALALWRARRVGA